MSTKENIKNIMKKYNNNFKVSEVCYFDISKLLSINILTNLSVDKSFKCENMENEIKDALKLDVAVNFKYINPVYTFNNFSNLIIDFFIKRYEINVDIKDIQIDILDDIDIRVKINKIHTANIDIDDLTNDLISYLSRFSFKLINVNIEIDDTLRFEADGVSGDIISDRNAILNKDIGNDLLQKRDYKINGLDIIIGKNFTDIAICLSQVKSEVEFIQVAGKIRYFQERSFIRKTMKDDVEVEEERIFYTFELYDGFGKIRASYFPTKAYLENEKKIGDGQEITICGKIEKYNDNLSLKVKEIAYCCLPAGQIVDKKSTKDSIHIKNTELADEEVENKVIEFKNEPLNYSVAFPTEYIEPNQIDLFTAINGENVVPMLKNKDFVVFDLETTGLDYATNEILEIGAVKVRNGKIIEVFNTLCKPNQKISDFITELTGIDELMVADAPKFENIVGDFYKFTRNSTLVAHNSDFDTQFLDFHATKCGYKFDNPVIDTLVMSRKLIRDIKNHKLGTIAKYFNIPLDHAHRALFDTIATAKCFIELCKLESK